MVNDYSRRYSRAGVARQKVADRKSSGPGDRGLFWKLAGLLISGALLCSLFGSLWFGYMIRRGLRELGTANVALEKKQEENRLLHREKNQLLSRSRIEKKVREEAGLYRPSAKQIIRP